MDLVRIGHCAGDVWQLLDKKGAISVEELASELKERVCLVQLALGWLAREGKVVFLEKEGSVTVSLCYDNKHYYF